MPWGHRVDGEDDAGERSCDEEFGSDRSSSRGGQWEEIRRRRSPAVASIEFFSPPYMELTEYSSLLVVMSSYRNNSIYTTVQAMAWNIEF
jgi:hypothetical protein